jgi:starvation-inducible DNA-binding protein
MSEVCDKLKVVLADSFAMYLKTHNYHWNVEGPEFPQYHALFDELYSEIWEAVDSIAEHIRALDEYSPGSFSRFSELTSIEDATTVPTASAMVAKLLSDNEKVLTSLKEAYDAANESNEIGLSNFLQDRTDIHKNHGWKLRATSRKS